MDLKLPTILTSKQDVVRAHRELSIFLDKMLESIMRHDNPVKYPAISTTLRAVAAENQVDLRDEGQGRKLLSALEQLQDKAPLLHISFPTDPPAEVLQKMVTWFRKEVNPHIVVQTGLQPTIAAGIVMYTTSRHYDFSLRRHLYNHRQQLIEVLGGKVKP